MEKPIEIVLEEFKVAISDVINNSKLPMCLITPVLKDAHDQCFVIEQQQLEAAKKQYEEQNQEKKQDENTKQ